MVGEANSEDLGAKLLDKGMGRAGSRGTRLDDRRLPEVSFQKIPCLSDKPMIRR